MGVVVTRFSGICGDVRSYGLLLRFTSRAEDGHQYLVEIYNQPLHRYLIAKLYHWYDMRVFKLPGFRKFERWHKQRFGKDDWTFDTISCRQDMKCFFLAHLDKEVLAEFEVDEATYVRLVGRAVKAE